MKSLPLTLRDNGPTYVEIPGRAGKRLKMALNRNRLFEKTMKTPLESQRVALKTVSTDQ